MKNKASNGNQETSINAHLNCSWTECSHQKTQNARLCTKAKTFNLLPRQAHPRAKDTYRLKGRGWEKIFHANGQDRKARVAILISDKIDFKMKAIRNNKEGHYG